MQSESGKAKEIVLLTGAGISTSAGIPDFRSPETGLYANLEKYNLPYPEAIFEISYFVSHPQAFYTLASHLYPGNFQPTLTHCFFALLHRKGILRRCFTQNIDTLESIAGLPAEKIVEAHGSFGTATCLSCKSKYSADDIRPEIMEGKVVRCQKKSCKGKPRALIKPGMTKTEAFSCLISQQILSSSERVCLNDSSSWLVISRNATS